jgi:hypothetical protein
MNTDAKRERVLLFIYGELSPDEEKIFRSELAIDPELEALLEQERRFDEFYPDQAETASAPLLEESRLLLRAALRREQRRFGWSALWDNSLWGAWLRPVFALCLGALLGWGYMVGVVREEMPVALGDVVGLHVLRYDETSGHTELSVRTLMERTLEGNIEDEAVQMLLASALRSSERDEDRLQAVDWLQPKSGQQEIRRALIEALREDENPGVRVKVAEVLASMAAEKEVRQVFRQALKQDENMGV